MRIALVEGRQHFVLVVCCAVTTLCQRSTANHGISQALARGLHGFVGHWFAVFSAIQFADSINKPVVLQHAVMCWFSCGSGRPPMNFEA